MRVILDDNEIIDLGITDATPTITMVDYSVRETDNYGVTTVTERDFARRMAVKLIAPFDQASALQRTLADLRATAAQWVAHESIAWLNFRGYYKDFEFDLAVPPVSYCTLTVEGLTSNEPFDDTGEDPAPNGETSVLQLLQPVVFADGSLAYTNVPEDDYPEWSVSTNYAVGARVIKAAAHRIYESGSANNLGNEPLGASGKWTDIGPTNRWAMFDQALGSTTSQQGSIKVDLAVGVADAVALLDVTPGSSVRVQTTDYDRTQIAVEGATLTFLDLPGGSDPIGVTIAADGQVSVGTLLAGPLVGLGSTMDSPKAGISDYSRKDVDEFGAPIIVERAWAKRMSLTAMIRTDAIDLVAGRIADVRARPSLWIGKEGLDAVTAYGFFKDFSIEVGTNVSKLSLTIEGLSTAGKIEPLRASVDWPAVGDPVGTKPQDNADVTSENTSKDTAAVAGTPATQVIDRIQAAHDAINAVDEKTTGLISDVDGLIETYGDTASAAASADAAAQHEANALLAADTSGEARDAAQAARDAAAGILEGVGTIRDAVVIAKTDAETARGQAQTFRDQSSQSATNAAGAASFASDYATSSATARDASQLAAAASVTARDTAVASADDAGRSASASRESALLASTALQALLPATFENLSNWTWDWQDATSDWTNDARVQSTDHPTLGRIAVVDNDPAFSPHFATKGRVPLVRDHIYRFTVRWLLAGAQDAQANVSGVNASMFIVGVKSGGATPVFEHDVSILPGQTGWGTDGFATRTFTCAANELLDQGVQWIRPLFRLDSQGVFYLKDLDLRDATGEENAKAAASAASLSAENASASEDAAGQQATASRDERILAQTARGQAEGFQQLAAQSKTDAEGASAESGRLAGLAAAAKKSAEDAASAANIDADTASAGADAAGQSATAAETSMVRASTFALDAAGHATNNIVGRSSFDERGKGNWQGQVQVLRDDGAGGFYVLQQTNRDAFEGEFIPGDWSGRRFRVSGNAAAFGAYIARAGLRCLMADGSHQYYIVAAGGPYQGYADFSGEFVLPANVSAAHPFLQSDGPWDAGNHGVNWRTIRVEDVSAQKAAEDFADAASYSFEQAEIKSGEAGEYAAAASGHADTARIKAGDAEGFAEASEGSAAVATSKASQAASSAVLAASYTVGLNKGNMLANSRWLTTAAPWYPVVDLTNFYFGRGGADFADVEGEQYLGLLGYQTNASQSAGAICSEFIFVEPGQIIDISAWLASRECVNFILMQWGDGNRNYLRDAARSIDVDNAYRGGSSLSSFKRVTARDVVPNDVRSVRLTAIKGPWVSSPDQSWLFMTRPMVTIMSDMSTATPEYVPAGPYSGLAAAAARIQDNAVVAAAAGQAAAQVRQDLTATAGDINGRLTTASQVAATALDRTSGARWSKEAVAGNGRAQLTVYAFDNNGNLMAGVDIIGDLTISGNLFVNGSVFTNKLAPNSVNRPFFQQLSGTIGIPAGSSSTIFNANFGVQDGISTLKIDANLRLESSDNVIGLMSLLRDEQTIDSINLNIRMNGAVRMTQNISLRDPNPGVGNHNYQVRFASTAGQSYVSAIAGSSLDITEVMR